MSIDVFNDKDQERYVVAVDGDEAGFAAYHFRGGSIYFFYHTEIGDAFAGQGLGSQLARGALDDVRDQGSMVVPLCPFIAGWLKKHPEYDDLIDHELWDRVLKRTNES